MAQGKLTADGSTEWLTVTTKEGAKTNIFVAGTFGSGTITVEKQINGNTSDLLQSGVAITMTAADDNMYNLAPRVKIRLTLAGSTSPAIDWQVPGAIEALGA